MSEGIGDEIYGWMKDLFPINRSLTGNGVRKTLDYLQKVNPDLKIQQVKSGYKAFDWTVPKEWNIENAFIEDETGNRIVDFKENNLHIVGYSVPVDKWVSLNELQEHLYSLPEQPNAIPYVTSYYQENWGFCLSNKQRVKLKEGKYHVVIDSELKDGYLNYGELTIPGTSKKEVFLSTYICHPSMANNELSGPVVTSALGRWLRTLKNRKYTYRIIFIPETIGSIVYINRNLQELKKNVNAGFNITCVGDDRCYSYVPSRSGKTLSDRVALHVLKHAHPDFKKYTWLDRGSDERQYCSPKVDLPMATIARSKYEAYPEYHTSLDNLSMVSPQGLEGSFNTLKTCIEVLEQNNFYETTVLCEPQMGKRGLYPTISKKNSTLEVKKMMNFISYCDGEHSVLEIADLIKVPAWTLFELIEILLNNGLIKMKTEEIV